MIIKLNKIDSTNRYALREFANVANDSLIVADAQDAGRGRRGKSWFSPPGVNMYASYIIKEPLFPIYVSLWICGLAVLKTLRDTAPNIDLWLKWPNDIYCTPQHNPLAKLKMAGLLAETFSPLSSNKITGIVAGMGINLNMQKEDIEKINRPATSLFYETGIKTDLANFAENLLRNLFFYRNSAETKEEELFAEWRHENRLLNRNVTVRQDHGLIIEGEVVNFSRSGEMIIFTKDGTFQNIMSGELESF